MQHLNIHAGEQVFHMAPPKQDSFSYDISWADYAYIIYAEVDLLCTL